MKIVYFCQVMSGSTDFAELLKRADELRSTVHSKQPHLGDVQKVNKSFDQVEF